MKITAEGGDLLVDLHAEGPVAKGPNTLTVLRKLPSRRYDKERDLWVVPNAQENREAMRCDSALNKALLGLAAPAQSLYRLDRHKNLLVLRTPPSAEDVAKSRAIPEYRMWNAELGAWAFRVTRRNVDHVRRSWPGIEASPEAAELIAEVLGNIEEVTAEAKAQKVGVVGAKALMQQVDETPRPKGLRRTVVEVLDYKFKTKPFAHQAEAFVLCRDAEAFALFMEQGTGKTKVAIDKTAWLHIQGKITGLLVVCPNAVKSNWVQDEIPTHMPDYVQTDVVEWRSTMGKADQENLARILGPVDPTRLAVLVMNVEAFSTKRGADVAAKFAARHAILAVVDESSRIKKPGAKRTKAVLKVGRMAKYRLILTGTPVTQGPLDVFAQFKFLDDRILGFSSFYGFRNHFAILGGFRGKQVVAYANLDELQRLVDPHSFRVEKDECLDLPPKVYQRLTVDLSPDQKRLYKAMKEDMLAEFGDTQASATEVIVQMLRLQQIVGGFLPVQNADGDYVATAIPGENPKLEALVETLGDAQGKAIVWARFRAEIDLIARRLREEFGADSVVEFHGGVDEVSRTRARHRFQDPDSPVRFFVGQSQTGGIGLTLTQARTVVYYSNDFSLETRLQSEDRAHRIGQQHSVTYVDLVARGTLDTQVLAALREKKSLANMVTGDAWKTWI